MAPKGSVTSASLEQYKSFTARFITKDSVKAIKELHGFFFLIDGTMMIYNYRNLGKTIDIYQYFIEQNDYIYGYYDLTYIVDFICSIFEFAIINGFLFDPPFL